MKSKPAIHVTHAALVSAVLLAGASPVTLAQLTKVPSATSTTATPTTAGTATFDISTLSPKDLAALSIDRFQMVTPEHIRKLKKEQIQALSSTQLTKLSIKAFQGFDWTWLTDGQLKGLRNDRFDGTDPTVETYLLLQPAIERGAFSKDTKSNLIGSTNLALTDAKIAALTTDQINKLSLEFLESGIAVKSHAIDPQVLNTISDDRFELVIRKSAGSLQAKQLAKLSAARTDLVLSKYGLYESQVKNIPAETAKGMKWTWVPKAMGEAQQRIYKAEVILKPIVELTDISKLTVADISKLTKEQLISDKMDTAKMTKAQVQALSPEQFNLMSDKQIKALDVGFLAEEQIGKMFKNDVQYHPVMRLSTPQMEALTIAQISKISVEQIKIDNTRQGARLGSSLAIALTVKQLESLSQNQLGAMNSADRDSVQRRISDAKGKAEIDGATPTQIALIPVDKVALWTDKHFYALTKDKFQALTAVQINALPLSKKLFVLDKDRVGWLKPTQIAGISANQMNQIFPPPRVLTALKDMYTTELQTIELFGLLSAEQFKAITPVNMSTVPMKHISVTQMGWLSNDQIKALTEQQTREISPAQAKALTPAQLSMMDSGAFNGFYKDVINALSSEQIKALSKVQLEKIKPNLLSNMTEAQFSALTAEQIKAIPAASIGQMTLANVTAAAAGLFSVAQMQAAVTEGALSSKNLMNPDRKLALKEVAMKLGITSFELAEKPVPLPTPAEISKWTKRDSNPAKFLNPKERFLAQLTAPMIAAIPTAVITEIKSIFPTIFESLKPEQIGGLTAEQISAMGIDNFKKLKPSPTTHLSGAAINSLAGAWPILFAQIRFVEISDNAFKDLQGYALEKFGRDDWSKLTPERMKSMSDYQLKVVKFQWIPTRGDITTTQAPLLSNDQLSYITATDFAKYSPEVLNAFKAEQWYSLPAKSCAALSQAQLKGITNQTLQNIPKEVMELFDKTLVQTLTADHLAAMSDDQRWALYAKRRAGDLSEAADKWLTTKIETGNPNASKLRAESRAKLKN
jgi:hypothetical protein